MTEQRSAAEALADCFRGGNLSVWSSVGGHHTLSAREAAISIFNELEKRGFRITPFTEPATVHARALLEGNEEP